MSTKFSLKPGVSIRGIRSETVLGICLAQIVMNNNGYNCVVTSVTDSKHGFGSLHFVGAAFDMRSRHVPVEERAVITKELKEVLGDEFDVVLERDHWHIEFQPKLPANS